MPLEVPRENWRDASLSVEGTPVHYYQTGERQKPPLILLHGLMDNGACWGRVARDFARDYDIVMVDMRYHGRSGGFSGGFSYDVLANDVVSVMRALGLGPAYLFGHSIGGLNTLIIAANFPELVRAIVLEDPFLPGGSVSSVATDEGNQQALQSILAFKTLSEAERLVQARQLNPGWDDEELPPWVESKIELDIALFANMEGALVYPWREALARIVCPQLLITADPQRYAIVTPALVEEIQQIWKDGEVLHIPDAGHCIHRDRYPETISRVRAFLESH